MTLTALILAVIYLGWRVLSLQNQCDELRSELLRVKSYCWTIFKER